MRNALIVGLTGQTGAGKSTFARMMKKFGYAVVDADRAARKVLEPGSKTLKLVTRAFGKEILNDDGSLDRKRLAELAFASEEATEALNALTHPAICELMLKEAQERFLEGYEAVILDASQLFESGLDARCALIFSVLAPEEDRRKRIQWRDHIDETQANARMAAQYPEAYFVEHSDFLIHNTGSKEDLHSQAVQTARILELAIAGKLPDDYDPAAERGTPTK
ncbi:MAG: dephospho-CoA kinase [Clostridia bacterium]|nr:dephospho-CoA kinase [Clostridia bacterium]